MLTFGFILEALAGPHALVQDQVLTDAAIDSRRVIPGSLFVALKGESADGHDFVGDAFNRGAMVALVDHPVSGDIPVIRVGKPLPAEILQNLTYPVCLQVDNTLEALQTIAARWREERSELRVIGITGSVGKSTSKELVAEVLDRRFRTFKNPGNFNNEIGLPLSMLRLTEMHERAVLEMGFYVPGEIKLLCGIARPQVGVVTNISEVHLERAGSIEAIVAGKRELVESLPPDGTAILNFDDERVRGMASSTRARVFMYGLSPEADLWADDIESLGLEGIRFVLHHAGDQVSVRVPMLGRHSVHTALRAAAVGLVEGLTWDAIIRGLQTSNAQLRLVAVNGPGNSLILDDTYNAAPPSVIAALNLLAELDGRRIAVLGDMYELGSFEEHGHRMVGARAAEVVDRLVAVGPLARWIADEAQKAGLSERYIATYETTEEASAALCSFVEPDDIILVKGSRGMHMEDIVSALEELE